MRLLLCLALLVALVCVVQASTVSVQDRATLLAKVAKTFTLKELIGPEMDETDPDKVELLKVEAEVKRRQNGEKDYVEPKYHDEYARLHAKAEAVKNMLDVSAIETKAEIIAGLRRPVKHQLQANKLHSKVQMKKKDPTKEVLLETNAKSEHREENKNQQQEQGMPTAMKHMIHQQHMFRQGERIRNKLYGRSQRTVAQRYEDCMACRMIWRQVEMDVANARYVEDVESSFEHNCMDAQKSMIFYKACQDMQNDLYAMVDDYMSGEYTVDKMCIKAHMC